MKTLCGIVSQVLLLAALCLTETTSNQDGDKTFFARDSSFRSRDIFSLDRRQPDAAAADSLPNRGHDLTLLNHDSWRQNLSDVCLNATAKLWDGEYDNTRLVYISYVMSCILALTPQNATLPIDELDTTVCDVCSTNFATVCEATGATLCSVDSTFTRTDATTNTTSRFKYRLYECIPDDCAADEEAFAIGWADDIFFGLNTRRENQTFDVSCPRVDSATPIGVDDTEERCGRNFLSTTCDLDNYYIGADYPRIGQALRSYFPIPGYSTFILDPEHDHACQCLLIPFDVGNRSEHEFACLCDRRARALEEVCVEHNQRFCYNSFTFLREENGEPRPVRHNFTYFDCYPPSCDNPLDLYSLTAIRYEIITNETSAFGATFEAFCYEEEQATRLLHSDTCEEEEEVIRSQPGDQSDVSTENAYRDGVVQCLHDALGDTPRVHSLSVDCVDSLEPYRRSCTDLRGQMCSTDFVFDDTVDAAFGPQTFNVVAYQCVAPECDNDFDRSVFENQDRWLLEAALGIEENAVQISWDCPPIPAFTYVPSPMPSAAPSPMPTETPATPSVPTFQPTALPSTQRTWALPTPTPTIDNQGSHTGDGRNSEDSDESAGSRAMIWIAVVIALVLCLCLSAICVRNRREGDSSVGIVRLLRRFTTGHHRLDDDEHEMAVRTS